MGLGTGSSLGGSPTADRPLTPRTAPAALAAGSLRAAADVGRAAAARRSALPRTGCRGADRRRGAADLTQVHRTRVALGQLLALRGCISRSISVAARCLSLRSLRLALTALPDFFVVWSSWGDLSAMDLLPRRRREGVLSTSGCSAAPGRPPRPPNWRRNYGPRTVTSGPGLASPTAAVGGGAGLCTGRRSRAHGHAQSQLSRGPGRSASPPCPTLIRVVRIPRPDTGAPRAPELEEHRGDPASEGRHAG